MEERAEAILFYSLSKSTILAVDGVKELLKEEFNNELVDIIEKLENEQKVIDGN